MRALLLALTATAPTAQEPPRPDWFGLVVLGGGREPGCGHDLRPRSADARLAGAPVVLEVDRERPGEVRRLDDADGTLHLRLDPREPGALSGDRDLGAAVRAAPEIRLVGGTTQDWFDVLVPRGRSPVLVGAAEAFGLGATLHAEGRTAQALAAWNVVPAEELRDPVRNPRRGGPERLVTGLGFLPWGLVETETAGSLERMLPFLVDERLRFALFLGSRSAVVAAPEDRWALVHGQDPVLVFDARPARRLRGALDGVRLSVLGDGDRWDHGARGIELAAPSERLAGAGERVLEVEDALRLAAWRDALDAFGSDDPPRRVLLVDASWRVELSADVDTRRARRPGEPARLARLRLGLRAR